MTSVDEDKQTTFDHHSPEYAENSTAINAELRARCPVAHTDAHGGFWVVTRYDDVLRVAKDDETFASGYEVNGVSPLGVTIPPAPVPHYPIEMDPPECTPYRKVLNPLFSPAVSESWRPRVEHWVDVCLDEVIESGTIDLVDDLANPIPALFTSEFLGLPLQDWREYAELMHAMIYTPPAEQQPLLERYFGLFGGIFGMIADRKTNPRDDAITALVQAKVNGEPMPDEMVASIINLVIVGGFDTTTGVAANALIHLADHPEQRQWLIDDPSRIPQACEEFLRVFTPQQALARTVTKPVILGGVELQPGERVLMSWASANHDETVFENPDEVVLDRFPNRHTTFGIGIHRCLGSHIARTELAVMIERVLQRLPDYTVDHANAQRYPTIGIVNGWITAPATFTPGMRLGEDRLP